jgi:hypothetical protein
MKAALQKAHVVSPSEELEALMQEAKANIERELRCHEKARAGDLRAVHLEMVRFSLRLMLELFSDKECRRSQVVRDLAKCHWLDDPSVMKSGFVAGSRPLPIRRGSED